MSIIKAEDNKKWINAFIAIIAILVGYILIQFVNQMGEWFNLEAKVKNFFALSQGLGIVAGLATFLGMIKNVNTMTLLNEVYDEIVKVVWPDKDTVLKITVGLVIGISIISGVFVLVDYLFQQALQLVY
jgi:preprotein translocase subunit SecE